MISGRKPKAEHRHRVTPAHEWMEVPDFPFEGGPELSSDRNWPGLTKRWWADVSTMPHCLLWTKSDWRFALDTVLVEAAFHHGDLRQAVELRRRERIMGITMDARRDLRIRYVEPPVEEKTHGVTAVEEYRRRLSA